MDLDQGIPTSKLWLASMAEKDKTWCFWQNFVLRHALSYITLFLSIRGGLWHLRLGSVKQIAPLFAAFDRPHYQKLIPQHLNAVSCMPNEVIKTF